MQSDNDTDWASEGEESFMQDAVRNLTAMMAAMNSRLNKMDGGGRKRGKLSAAAPDTEAATPARAPSLPARPSTSQRPTLDHATVPAPLPVRDHAAPALGLMTRGDAYAPGKCSTTAAGCLGSSAHRSGSANAGSDGRLLASR